MADRTVHECDALLLRSALEITGDPARAIESAARVGDIAQALRPYPKDAKAEMLKALISVSQE